MCNTWCNFDEWESCETHFKVQLLSLFLSFNFMLPPLLSSIEASSLSFLSKALSWWGSSFFHGLFPSGWCLLSPLLLYLSLHLHGGKSPLKDLIEAQRSSLHRSFTRRLPSPRQIHGHTILENILKARSLIWYNPSSLWTSPRLHRRKSKDQGLCRPHEHFRSRPALREIDSKIFNSWCIYLLLCFDWQENAKGDRSHRLKMKFPNLTREIMIVKENKKVGLIMLCWKLESNTISPHQGARQASPCSRWQHSSHERRWRVSSDGSLLVKLLWRLDLWASMRSFNGDFPPWRCSRR